MEEAVTPIDEFVMKGAKTNFEDARVHRHVVEGHAPVPPEPGREYVPRRARLIPNDFEEHGYTAGCRGCEYLQTGLGGRQGHNDQCRARIEDQLEQTDEGQARLGRTKDRIEHWIAKDDKKQTEETKVTEKDEKKDVK